MLVIQNAANPSVVLDAIVDSAPVACTKLFVASAYVTREGTRLLFDRLRHKLGAAAFGNLSKRLVTTFDYGLTDPDAIKDWEAEGAKVWIANAGVIQAGNLNPPAAYHPKVYGYRTAAGVWEVVSGSANLTGRGMTINAEAVSGASVPAADMRAAIDRLRDGAVRADPALIAAYRALKAALPPPASLAVQVTPVPAPVAVAANALETLWEAIASGNAVPPNHQRFWIQTMAMSGGSGSQLELPRGANRFFGLAFANYAAGAKVTIGRPRLRSGGSLWVDRILSWHGNNGMERLNMPTPAMSGFTYGNSAVSFRRKGADYEFEVAPWTSSLANSWRSASTAAGTIYRLGGNSPRVCGLI